MFSPAFLRRVRDMQESAEMKAESYGDWFTEIAWGYFNGSNVYRCLPVYDSCGERIIR